MKLKPFILIFIAVLASSYVNAPSLLFSTSVGTITFTSDAPLELIQANSAKLKGWVNPDTKQFSFSVDIKSFKGFKIPTQQKQFNETYLESDSYPEAGFEGKIIENINMRQDGIYSIRAKGNLTIHGVTQERIIKCNLVIKKGTVTAKANFIVLLADHNISIPKILSQKLANDIKVEVNTDLSEK
ncbi:MAG TPA: YceI family protein [Ferruginibacter sp.]|nr:YceI family protein [Ferruginibacter sp.]